MSGFTGLKKHAFLTAKYKNKHLVSSDYWL